MRASPQLRAGAIAAAIAFAALDGCPIESVRGWRGAVWVEQHWRVSQWWAIYQQPGGTHDRLWIDGETPDGTWHLVFRAGDPEHAEDAELLDSARVWGAYTPAGGTPPQYGPFCAWISDRVLADHRDFVRARVRLERIELERGELQPSGQFEYVRMRGRR
jgi:hypothetical protein